MFHIRRSLTVWIGACGILGASAGCSMTPKLPTGFGANNSKSPMKVTASGGTRSSGTTTSAMAPGGFSTKNELTDPGAVYLSYGRMHEMEGNLVEARNAYIKVLESKPEHWWSHGHGENVDALLGLVRLDIATNRMNEAMERLNKVQRIAPKNPQVAITAGQYYLAAGDLNKALEQMTLAQRLSPECDPTAAYHLGLVQAKLGQLESALDNFTLAVGTAEAQYNLGYILYQQGKFDLAEGYLRQAISVRPGLQQAQELLVAIGDKRAEPKQEIVRRRGTQRNMNEKSSIQTVSHSRLDRDEENGDRAGSSNGY